MSPLRGFIELAGMMPMGYTHRWQMPSLRDWSGCQKINSPERALSFSKGYKPVVIKGLLDLDPKGRNNLIDPFCAGNSQRNIRSPIWPREDARMSPLRGYFGSVVMSSMGCTHRWQMPSLRDWSGCQKINSPERAKSVSAGYKSVVLKGLLDLNPKGRNNLIDPCCAGNSQRNIRSPIWPREDARMSPLRGYYGSVVMSSMGCTHRWRISSRRDSLVRLPQNMALKGRNLSAQGAALRY